MRRHVFRLAILIALSLMFGAAAMRAQEPDTSAARLSVDTWLSLVDNQSYAASWDSAASIFRSAISSAQWQAAVQGARAPLGALKSRTLKSATATRTLPGAPDGDYVVFQFTTAFEHKDLANETATTLREKDGTWRVAGYFVK